jgi:hypothetical protein
MDNRDDHEDLRRAVRAARQQAEAAGDQFWATLSSKEFGLLLDHVNEDRLFYANVVTMVSTLETIREHLEHRTQLDDLESRLPDRD